MSRPLVAASILSGDFARLGEEVKSVTDAGSDRIHIDVMDGVFVPNITFGPKTVKDIRPYSPLFFDVHLMIVDPIKYVGKFAKSGADLVSFHVEAEKDIDGALDIITTAGCKCGLAISPDTPLDALVPYLEKIDLILIMSVYPGFGGQKFIPDALERLGKAAALRDRYCPHALVEVDGGVNLNNAAEIAAAGADILVAGNAVFSAVDRKEAIQRLRGEQ